MSREINRFHANLKNLDCLIALLPRALGLPKVVLEKSFLPTFKKIYSNDILNLLAYIRGDDESSRKSLQNRLTPALEDKIRHLEDRLKVEYDKVSSLVLKMKWIQKIKEVIYEASVVLLVTYFEDFLKASFATQINRKPIRSLPFIEKQVRVADLKEFGFNLSRKMGHIIAGKINFQNLEETAKAYQLAFGVDIFNKNLTLKREMIVLLQIRHLIVHSNSIIDKEYVKVVKCNKSKIGKRLNISKKDLEEYKKILLKTAEHIEKDRLK